MLSIWKDRKYMTLEVIPRTQNCKSKIGSQFLPGWSNVFSIELIKSLGRTIQGRASLQMVSHWSPNESSHSLPSRPGTQKLHYYTCKTCLSSTKQVNEEWIILNQQPCDLSLLTFLHIWKLEERGRRNMT